MLIAADWNSLLPIPARRDVRPAVAFPVPSTRLRVSQPSGFLVQLRSRFLRCQDAIRDIPFGRRAKADRRNSDGRQNVGAYPELSVRQIRRR